jgi:predicted N-acyltransferase
MSSPVLSTAVDVAANPAKYRLEIAERVADLSSEDWDALRSPADCGFMDRRFVEAVEASRIGGGRCWSLLVYCGDRPMASACLSLFHADGAIVASGWARRATEWVRRLWPNYLKFNVLFCGLPVSAGEGHLNFAAAATGADRRQVVRLIDAEMRKLAREHRAKILIFKEFDEETYHDCAELEALGYIGVESTAVSTLECGFASFDDYLAAMRKRYRANIGRFERKFASAGMRLAAFSGDDAAERYTDEMHRLYEAVVEHSKTRLEILPAEFFRQLARRFEREFLLIAAYDGQRPVGFFSAIRATPIASTLFVGLDYERSAEACVYHNLFYAYLREVLSPGLRRIEFGANSDDFKARIGCRQRANYMYVAATNWLRWPLGWFSGALFPRVKLLEPMHVFRSSDGQSPGEADE